MRAHGATIWLTTALAAEAMAGSVFAGARVSRNIDGSIKTAELSEPGPARDTLEEGAWAFIDAAAADLGVTRDDLRLAKAHHSYAGGSVVFEQRHAGMPVVEGSLDLYLDASNRVTTLSSRLKRFSRAVTERRIAAPSGAKSVLYVRDGVARLAYETQTGPGKRGITKLIDAESGERVLIGGRAN